MSNFFTQSFKDLIQGMLAYDPAQRFTIAQIKEHPWYTGTVPTEEEVRAEMTIRHQMTLDVKEKERKERQQRKEET